MHPLYPYLHRSQRPYTGLMESFADSQWDILHEVVFTYDLALTAMMLTHHGAHEEAGVIIDFFRSMPMPAIGSGNFNTAYHVRNRAPALEQAVQIGPMAWTALAMLRYAERTQQRLYFHKAVQILDWVRRCVPHREGGLVMGIRSPWSNRMSVENNWAVFAALRVATQGMADGITKGLFLQEMRDLHGWLVAHEGNRGYLDPVKALDVYTSPLLVGPQTLAEFRTNGNHQALAHWAKAWINEMIMLFRVPGTAAFDFTDAAEARRVDRPRIGWLEGTEQVSIALRLWAPWFRSVGDPAFADEIERLGVAAHEHVVGRCMTVHGSVAIPNTDSPESLMTFADGWLARPLKEPALNGTTWGYFSDVGFNPYTHSLAP